MRQTVLTILLAGAASWLALPSSAAAQQADCGRHHHCFGLLAPPHAPVLGSAPALMAPIVLTPPQQHLHQDALQELRDLKALSDLLSEFRQEEPPADNRPAARPTRGLTDDPPPRPPQDDLTQQRLDRLDAQIRELSQGVGRMESLVVEALKGVDQRLQRVEQSQNPPIRNPGRGPTP